MRKLATRYWSGRGNNKVCLAVPGRQSRPHLQATIQDTLSGKTASFTLAIKITREMPTQAGHGVKHLP